MLSRERVVSVLARKIPDRVPTFEFLIDSKVIDAIIPGADLYDFVEKVGLDAIALRPDMKREKLEENLFKDERGVIARRYPTADYLEPVNRVIKNEKDLKKFEFPDPSAPYRLNSLKKAIDRFKGKVAIITSLRYGWSEVRALHGLSETLIDLVDNPKFIRRFLEKAADYYLELGKLSAKLGAEIVCTTDDVAGKNGLLMSPKHFKEIVYPVIKRLYKSWRGYGLYVIKHCDGNIYPIMDLLIETDLDCLHPIEPTAGMSLAKVKKEYGDKICIMGNVNCAGNLVFGSKRQVVEEVKRCIDVAAPGGGYILSSSNSITRDVKPENYIAMLDTVKKYGKYY